MTIRYPRPNSPAAGESWSRNNGTACWLLLNKYQKANFPHRFSDILKFSCSRTSFVPIATVHRWSSSSLLCCRESAGSAIATYLESEPTWKKEENAFRRLSCGGHWRHPQLPLPPRKSKNPWWPTFSHIRTRDFDYFFFCVRLRVSSNKNKLILFKEIPFYKHG